MAEGHMLTLPSFTEADTINTKVYPNTARLRNITYAGDLFVKVRHTVQRDRKLKRVDQDESRKLRKIGRIPIMVMSNCCRLFSLKSEQEFESLRECSMDPGGYFIIDGKERVRNFWNFNFIFRMNEWLALWVEALFREVPSFN